MAPFLDAVLAGCDVLLLQETAHDAADGFGWLRGFTAFTNAEASDTGRMLGRPGEKFGVAVLVRHGLAATVVARGARFVAVEVRGAARSDAVTLASVYWPMGVGVAQRTIDRWATPQRRPNECPAAFAKRAERERVEGGRGGVELWKLGFELWCFGAANRNARLVEMLLEWWRFVLTDSS